MSTYVSPMVRARALVAGLIPANKGQTAHARRIVNLPTMIIIDLEREEAPVHVFRWVAWGATKAEQRRRTDLVIYLRRWIARPRNGWFKDRHFAAALAEWDRGRSEARKRGGIMPNFDQIPVETYETVIRNAQPRPSSPEMAQDEGEQGGAVDEDEDEDEDDDEDEADDDIPEETDGEKEPVSTRGRDQLLRHLSETVRLALAADDMEAADAVNDAILHLCGGRKRNE